jgi:hypothetical protein
LQQAREAKFAEFRPTKKRKNFCWGEIKAGPDEWSIGDQPLGSG